jgi:PAS domain S-box-containing protein
MIFQYMAGKTSERLEITPKAHPKKKGSHSMGKVKNRGSEASILEAMADGVIVLGMDGTILSVNPALTEMTGYRKEEIVGRNAFELISEMVGSIDSQRIHDVLHSTIQGAITPQTEFLMIARNGIKVPLSVTVSFIRDESGNPESVVATLRDMTEKKNIQEAYKNLIDYSLQGIALFQDGRIIFANDALSNIFGYTIEEIKEFSAAAIDRIIYPEDRMLLKERLKARLEGKPAPTNYEFRILRKNGNVGWVEVSSNSITYQSRPAIQVTVFDISGQKRAEEELQLRMDQLVILHNASQEVVQAGFDLEKMYSAIHRATSRLMPAEAFVISLYNERKKEIEAVYLIDKGGRWPSEKVRWGEGLSGKIISTGRYILLNDVPEQEIESIVRFGHPESVRSILAVPMRLGEKVVGMIATESYSPNAFDEEDRVLLEMLGAHTAAVLHNVTLFEEIRESNLTLEFINDLMSHDLTNINQVTLGYLDFLKETELSEKQRTFVETILYSTHRNMRLIGNVRKLWESSRVSPKSIDVDKCIRVAMEEINIFPGKKVKLNYTPKPYFALADEFLIDVVGNLIDNAIKFDSSEEVIIDISVIEEGDKCRISVADRGKGIPDAYKNTIFSRLERLEKGVRGTGLGLHLVKTIVSLYGGEVWVENNNPTGSIFNIRLPRFKNR